MKNNKLILIGAAILLVIGGYVVLNAPDQRTKGEKLGDAVDEMGNGLDNAADELDNRTLGEKMKDSLDDAKEDMNDNVDATKSSAE